MPKCPSCKKEALKMEKSWKYGQFDVNAYKCDCGTKFRNYMQGKETKFTLVQKSKGKDRWDKVNVK
jgi:hypothetical protein